jgi:TatD DNase family protein
MNLIDIGANLTHESFRHDLPQVLSAALAVGVRRMVITGASLQGSIDALALARSKPEMFRATIGMHPHHAEHYTQHVHDTFAALIQDPLVAAVGECGLDYFRDLSPRAAQRNAFLLQLEAAAQSGKPVFAHQRDAHADFVSMLQDFEHRIEKIVVHCFTGSADELDACLARGWYIGITGWICDERRGSHLKDIVGRIPRDRLMIETDAPYLLPRDLRPKPKTHRNEPQWLPHIAAVIAQARGESVEDLVAGTWATATDFFEWRELAA